MRLIWRGELGRPFFHDYEGELVSVRRIREGVRDVEGSVDDFQHRYAMIHGVISQRWSVQRGYDFELSRPSVDSLYHDGEIV